MKKLEEFVNDTEATITEELTYDSVIAKLQEAKENGTPIEEGLLGAVVGGVTGATIGPKIMKALCKALGVSETGPFGSLLTSRLILGSIGATVGWR